MADLTQQIRDRLDEWARPSGEAPPAFTQPANIDPEQAAVIQAAWDELSKADPGPHRIVVLPPSPFDLMRRAIIGLLELHAPGDDERIGDDGAEWGLVCIECGTEVLGSYPCPTVRVIAEKLGIEVGDGRA